jgi:hypothetical protein
MKILKEVMSESEEILLHDTNYVAVPFEIFDELEDVYDDASAAPTAPQQAIPSGWIDTGYLLEQLDAYGLSVDHLQMPMSTKLFVSAAPTAPIESDK